GLRYFSNIPGAASADALLPPASVLTPLPGLIFRLLALANCLTNSNLLISFEFLEVPISLSLFFSKNCAGYLAKAGEQV
ncbi:MAG: hypothetical protein IJE88_01785, partial [Akkermansia sp.]|nr:hypothetical protein [Akkermansia sp.]